MVEEWLIEHFIIYTHTKSIVDVHDFDIRAMLTHYTTNIYKTEIGNSLIRF